MKVIYLILCYFTNHYNEMIFSSELYHDYWNYWQCWWISNENLLCMYLNINVISGRENCLFLKSKFDFDIDYYKLHRLSFFSQYLGVLRSWRWFVPNVCPVKNRKFRVIFFQAWIFFTFENSYDKRFLSRRFQSEYVTKSELLLGTR